MSQLKTRAAQSRCVYHGEVTMAPLFFWSKRAALIIVASTIVPVATLRPLAASCRVKVDPRKLGSVSLFGMTPNNPVLQAMVATPIAPGVHADSIIAVAGDEPVEGSNDGVVGYSSSHFGGVDSEYIVRSTHSVQSNPHAIEEVRRILLVHTADVCTRIACGNAVSPPPSADMHALRLANVRRIPHRGTQMSQGCSA